MRKKNHLRVFEIYKRPFELKQADRSVSEFYKELKMSWRCISLIDKEMHQPVVTNAATLRIPPGSRNVKVHIWFESLVAITGVGLDTRREYSHIDYYFLQSCLCLFKLMCPLHYLLNSCHGLRTWQWSW